MSRWSARPTQLLTRIEVIPTITLEHMPTATLILDSHGRVLHFNQRAAALLERHGSMLYGMRAVELLGRDLLGASTERIGEYVPLDIGAADRPTPRRDRVAVAHERVDREHAADGRPHAHPDRGPADGRSCSAHHSVGGSRRTGGRSRLRDAVRRGRHRRPAKCERQLQPQCGRRGDHRDRSTIRSGHTSRNGDRADHRRSLRDRVCPATAKTIADSPTSCAPSWNRSRRGSVRPRLDVRPV